MNEVSDYEKKIKAQQSKAQAKYTKIGANYRNDEAEPIKAYCKDNDISINEFVKTLISEKLNPTSKPTPQPTTDKSIVDAERIRTLQATVKALSDELLTYKDKTPYKLSIEWFKSLIGR